MKEILLALAIMESGCDDAAIGAKGERTRLQIMPATWKKFSKVPIQKASLAEVYRVGEALWKDDESRVSRFFGRPAYTHEMYICWRMGYPKASKKRFRHVPLDDDQRRFMELVYQIRKDPPRMWKSTR